MPINGHDVDAAANRAVAVFDATLRPVVRLRHGNEEGSRQMTDEPIQVTAVLGSVTQRLLHVSPCPVLAVPQPRAISESAVRETLTATS